MFKTYGERPDVQNGHSKNVLNGKTASIEAW